MENIWFQEETGYLDAGQSLIPPIEATAIVSCREGRALTVFLLIVALFVLISIADLSLAVLCLKKGNHKGRFLGMTLLGAFIATSSYLASIWVMDYWIYSIFSGIYFSGVTVTVFSLYRFSIIFAGDR